MIGSEPTYRSDGIVILGRTRSGDYTPIGQMFDADLADYVARALNAAANPPAHDRYTPKRRTR